MPRINTRLNPWRAREETSVRVIDLRSDTVTLPTEEMRRAMYEAELGDDVYGEDPTVNALEQLAAEMMGKEAALLTVSGTMSNLLAVLAQTRPGDEVLLGSESHIFWYEVGGAAALGGAVMRTVPNSANGQMDLEDIEKSTRGENIHFPRSALLCLENTHNRCGGRVITPEYTSAAAALAHQHGLRVHLDGARIFNAAVALEVPASDLARDADSVCFCLSKGLSAPVGSLLCGGRDFIERARKLRKMVGGGMRQAGVIAAAGLVALRSIDRLAQDHSNARRLARGLASLPGIHVAEPETNIVLFEVPIPGPDFLRETGIRGVKLGSRGANRFRAVTHRMIAEADVDEAVERMAAALHP
jgi:threonine aldolase